MTSTLRRISLGTLAALTLAACGETPPPPTDLGIPWELARIRKATIHDLSYRIHLDVPRERDQPVMGGSAIRFVRDDPMGRDVVLDFMKPDERVRRAQVNGVEVEWSAVNDHMVFPASAFRQGSLNVIELEYQAGDEALNRNDDFLYALFVPDRAHFSLPVFDQPNLKAPVEWEVTAPTDWQVVANGPPLEMSGGKDRRTLRFLPTRPLPTYLFAVVVGDFDVEVAQRNGRPMAMYHRETDSAKVARNRDAIFDLHARALDWLEEYTGIDYPFQKFEFVLIPSFQYGGMEHPGGILYRQAGVMLDESATQGQILGRASVIAHETSHMWFGDLVTMNWFDDVWTKEVFANFMAAKIVQPSFPEVDHDLRFLMAHFPSAYGVDRTAGANPIRQPLENLREAGTLYGAIIYQKAPIVMRQLEVRVGEDAFRDGLREYLRGHEYGNATWPDLIEILDRDSPEDLAAWSHAWVEEAGRPHIVVERRDDATVTLRQEDPQGKGRVWPQRLGVRVGSVEADTVVTVELGARPVTVEVDRPAYVLPNGTGMEYGGFDLDDASRSYLVDHLTELEPALVRGAAWVTLWDQVLERRLEPGAFLDLALRGVASETVELNLSRILGYLGTTYWRFLPDAERARRAPELEGALWRALERAPTRTMKASLFNTYRTIALTDQAVARLGRLWEGTERVAGLTLSESDQIALASALALREARGWERILDRQEERIENPDRKARFLFVRPSLSPDPEVRRTLFEGFRDESNREHEPWVLEALGNIHHPLRAPSSEALILPGLELLEEIQRTGDIFFPGRWVGAILGGHGSVRAAETVHRFLADRPEYPHRLRLKILQAADMLDRSASIVHGWEGP